MANKATTHAVPSLFSLAAGALRAPGAATILNANGVDIDSLTAVQEMELAQLNARGRTTSTSRNVRSPHPGNRIDGAQLQSYDSETRTVRIRVDDSRNLEFWLEIDLPLDQLAQWLTTQQPIGNADMQANMNADDEDDEDDEDADSAHIEPMCVASNL